MINLNIKDVFPTAPFPNTAIVVLFASYNIIKLKEKVQRKTNKKIIIILLNFGNPFHLLENSFNLKLYFIIYYLFKIFL